MRPQGGGRDATVTPYLSQMRPGHPTADTVGRVRIHVAVLYDSIGPGEHPCHWCGRTLQWFIKGITRICSDHVDGNKWNNDPGNLVPACRGCNATRAKRADFLTHCAAGHEYTPATLYIRPDNGLRQCKACNRARQQKRAAA
jgi:hypothetical protein